jgi:hypothetical protein
VLLNNDTVGNKRRENEVSIDPQTKCETY